MGVEGPSLTQSRLVSPGPGTREAGRGAGWCRWQEDTAFNDGEAERACRVSLSIAGDATLRREGLRCAAASAPLERRAEAGGGGTGSEHDHGVITEEMPRFATFRPPQPFGLKKASNAHVFDSKYSTEIFPPTALKTSRSKHVSRKWIPV